MMIAMVVLAVGLGALTILFTTAMYTNTKSNKDTTATMLAQTVMEQIDAQSTNGAANFNITDCQGTAWLVNAVGAPGAHTFGRSLAEAKRHAVEMVALWFELEPEQFDIDWDIRLGDLSGPVKQARAAMAHAAAGIGSCQ